MARKRAKTAAKKTTTIIGDIRIPMHAVKAIHTFSDSQPAFPFHPDNPPALNDLRKVVGSDLVIVVDMRLLQEQVMFTEYFRTRQKPKKKK